MSRVAASLGAALGGKETPPETGPSERRRGIVVVEGPTNLAGETTQIAPIGMPV